MKLNLIGDFTTYNPSQPDNQVLYDFYTRIFSTGKEIGNIRNPARHIGYNGTIDAYTHFLFLGFEVDEIGAMPLGFTALEITDKTVRISKQSAIHSANPIEMPLQWTWSDLLHTHNQTWTVGDFSLDLSIISEQVFQGIHELWLSFNVFGQEETEDGDMVEIVEYNNQWPNEFTATKLWLMNYFPVPMVRRIEHIGSTSVPGLPAKPILDILIEIPSFSEARKAILPLLKEESWEYCWYNNHIILIKRDKYKGKRTHHLHLVTKNHEQWNCVLFRDYLKANPNDAQEYANLKRTLAQQYTYDRERYTGAKSNFVSEITKKAISYVS